MYRKLAAIANLKALSPAKKAILGLGGLGAVGAGIQNYTDSVSMPASDELLMMDLPAIPEDKLGALVNNVPEVDTSMKPAKVPTPPAPQSPRSETDYPHAQGVSATGSKQTSGKPDGLKNAAFLDGGILPLAAGGIGGYLVGEHLIAPHFARQQAAIAEQIAQGQQAMAAAARNQRISPLLAAAAGALLLSWLLSGNKKEEVRQHMGGQGPGYPMDLQGFNPYEQQPLSRPADPRNMGY